MPTYLLEGLLRQVQQDPAAVAVYSPRGRMTFGWLAGEILEWKWWMESDGVKPGDLVALMLPDGADLLPTAAAALLLGAKTLILDPRLPWLTVEEMVTDFRPRFLLTVGHPAPPRGDYFAIRAGKRESLRMFRRAPRKPQTAVELIPDQASIILATSAGEERVLIERPAACMAADGDRYADALGFAWTDRRRAENVLVTAPLSGWFGLTNALCPPLQHGVPVRLTSAVNASEERAGALRASLSGGGVWAATPEQIDMAASAPVKPGPKTQWRTIMTEWSVPDAERQKACESRLSARVASHFGSSWTGLVSLDSGQAPAGSVGRVLPGVKVEIRDGRKVKARGSGQVYIESNAVAARLWGTSMKGPFKGEGILTSLRGRVEDGWLFIEDESGS
jgi:acyl-coenzyme A synthetase/AMP-(fatty) acid ligase